MNWYEMKVCERELAFTESKTVLKALVWKQPILQKWTGKRKKEGHKKMVWK